MHDDVKNELSKSYCISIYCSYLWTDYKKCTYPKIRAAYNIYVFRKLFKLPPRSSALLMFDTNDVYDFESLI